MADCCQNFEANNTHTQENRIHTDEFISNAYSYTWSETDAAVAEEAELWAVLTGLGCTL